MEEKKVCETCKEPLIAFQGHYLHQEKPCSGIRDCIDIEAIISDKILNEKFKELYGSPEIDDIDRIVILQKQVSNPIIKFILKLLRL